MSFSSNLARDWQTIIIANFGYLGGGGQHHHALSRCFSWVGSKDPILSYMEMAQSLVCLHLWTKWMLAGSGCWWMFTRTTL